MTQTNDPDTAASPSPPSMGEAHRAGNQELPEQAGECPIGASAGLNLPGGSAGFCFFQAAVVSESSCSSTDLRVLLRLSFFPSE